MKTINLLSKLFLLFTFLLSPYLLFAAEKEIDIYYTESCPHCKDARAWMSTLGEDIQIDYFLLTDEGIASSLKVRLEEVGEQKSFGIVPIIFTNGLGGEDLFVGFDSAETTGEKILKSLEGEVTGSVTQSSTCDESEACGITAPKTVDLPIIGEIDTSKYSLGFLSFILGFLDGFNVCSLGALALILGIAISLKSRKKTILFGSLFILITGIVYAALIYLWYAIFESFSAYFSYFEYLVAAIGIVGGVYFIKEFIRMKKYGVTCGSSGNKIINSVTKWVQETLSKKSGMLITAGAVIAFATVLTIVEFPCSAAVPVMFSGILSAANIGPLAHLMYMLIFMIFYLFDEIIIFAIAAYKLNVWMSGSAKSTMIFTLIEGIILVAIGLFYLL